MPTKTSFGVAGDRMAKKKCWIRTDTNEYLGRLTHFEYVGPQYDPGVILQFETGVEIDEPYTNSIFKVVPCADASGGSAGGRRRHTRRRATRRRHTRRRR